MRQKVGKIAARRAGPQKEVVEKEGVKDGGKKEDRIEKRGSAKSKGSSNVLPKVRNQGKVFYRWRMLLWLKNVESSKIMAKSESLE
jgi:hypothetical protein